MYFSYPHLLFLFKVLSKPYPSPAQVTTHLLCKYLCRYLVRLLIVIRYNDTAATDYSVRGEWFIITDGITDIDRERR